MSKQTASNRGIIMIPYAYLVNSNTGVNIANRSKQVDIYMKNCCVACLSAKKYNDSDTDVALVTNIDPPKEYRDILESHKIKIIHADFDLFNFSGEYTWALAFYKLCALHHVLHEYDYDYYAYLDSDVFIQSSFNNIWTECDAHILLYDINHGLQVKHYQHILSEMRDFMPSLFSNGNLPTHYGGEFFAANRANTLIFIKNCEEIYAEMCQQKFNTTHGDEFIISIAADKLGSLIKNAGAYIYRFWTGSSRLISACYMYNPVVVLHVPAEKEFGMLAVYDKYIKQGRLPHNINKVYRLLHLTHPSLRTRIAQLVKRFKH